MSDMDYMSVTPLTADDDGCTAFVPHGSTARYPCHLAAGHAGMHLCDADVVTMLVKRIEELEAERDQWQESSGQNYVRAQDAEDREEKLSRRIEMLELSINALTSERDHLLDCADRDLYRIEDLEAAIDKHRKRVE